MQSLNINNLKISVYIGNTAAEQREKSSVIVCLKILFKKTLKACESDDLFDTICYDNLVKKLRKSISNRRFNLIEKLTKFIYDETKKNINRNDAKIAVKVTKINIPIENLESVSFIFGDHNVD